MSYKIRFYFLLLGAILLSSCSPHVVATSQYVETPSLIPLSPTLTVTPTLTQIPTPTQPATLTPLQVEKIRTLLQEPIDCSAPCFWGITPYKTTLDEAKSIFTYLGLQITEYNTVHFSVDDLLSGLISLDVGDNLVNSVSVSIDMENDSSETSRSWLAYSPESLIPQYGTPSNVEIIGSYVMDKVVFSESSKWYSMNIYFAEQDLIVYYEDGEFESETSSYLACPLKDKFRYIKLWFGENPKYPPPSTYPLEEVSNLNLNEFANLMSTKKDSACFELDEKIFN